MSRAFEIIGFPGYYVTDMGDVYSRNYNRTGRIKKIIPHKVRGYLLLTLCKNNKKFSKTVHRLVAQAFIPNPTQKPQINHKNGIKTDNRVENLEWCTQSENMLHAYRVIKTARSPNYWRGKLGKDNPRAKIVLQIKDDEIIAEFYGASEASRITGINRTNIVQCCSGDKKTAGGYQWMFKQKATK